MSSSWEDEACCPLKRNAELEARVRLLEEVVENVRHGICLFDGDGRIAFCNQRYPEVIGLPSSEVKPGTPIRRLVELASTAGFYPPDLSIDEIETKFWDNLRHDRVSPAQLQRDGRTFVIHPGQTTREGNLIATFEDISAQLAAEAALKQSEKRFSTMLEVMPDCVKIFNERAEITYINPKGLELLQAPDLETLLASGHQSLPSEYILEAIDVHRRVLAGECVVWNYEVIGMKGARRFVEAHAVSINLPDGTRGHMSITRDITGRKMAENALRHNEERLRLVQEATKLADFENDGGEVSHCSDRFFEQVGLPVGDNTISITTWMDLVHPDDRELLREEMELAIASADTFESEYRIVRPDNGQIRWISCRTRLFRDAEGKLCRTIGAHMDITDRKEHEIALEESEQRMRLVHEATGLAEFWVEKAGFAHVSDALIEQIGLPSGTTNLGFNELLKYVHPEDREILTEYVTSNNRGVNSFNCEFRIIHGRTGEVRWINSRTKSEFDEQGRILRTIGAHLDITDRKRMLEALRESEERFRLAAEGAGIGVWDFDPATQTRDWSARMLDIFGLDGNVERRLEVALDCVHRADRSRFQGMINAVANDEAEKIDDSLRIIRANDNSERWIAINCWKTSRTSSGTPRIILTMRDITEERTAEQRIRWAANHDSLTRLANRTLFQEKLEQIMRKNRVAGQHVGLLLLDLDHFKQINDSLGHDAGDRLLKMFAERIEAVVRPGDTVARLGGDEFAIILSDISERERLAELSDSIHERLRDPFVYRGQILDCRTSIGGAIFPEDGENPTELMKNADMALYSAKSSGRSVSKLYAPELRKDFVRRLDMVQSAREALRTDRILTFYQPKVDLHSFRVRGFEALLRWRAPNGEIRLPDDLRAAFEDLEVAAEITNRMVDQAITDMRRWLDDGLDFGHIAINASAADFRRSDFADEVLEKLHHAGVPSSLLQLEVTESVFLGQGAEYVRSALASFNSSGVKIALDDFGTGYASLRHLKQFPVDTIKIDRSFVMDMEHDPGDDAIVRAVINLGRNLGIDVVAEGIEEMSQVQRLVRYGCNVGQGFLFSRAQPASKVPSLLAGNRPGVTIDQNMESEPLRSAAG